jgi:hypothetical protein
MSVYGPGTKLLVIVKFMIEYRNNTIISLDSAISLPAGITPDDRSKDWKTNEF